MPTTILGLHIAVWLALLALVVVLVVRAIRREMRQTAMMREILTRYGHLVPPSAPAADDEKDRWPHSWEDDGITPHRIISDWDMRPGDRDDIHLSQ